MKVTLDDSNPAYRALLQLLRTADTVWNASHAFFEEWELSPSQFNVLNLLHLSPQGLSQTELSKELIMHRSNVTGLVDRLEKRGLLERKEGADRRSYRVMLTRAGEEVVGAILPGYYERAVEVWGGLEPARAEKIREELERVAANAERMAKESAEANPEGIVAE